METVNQILKTIKKANASIPKEFVTDLDINPLTQQPEWYSFEHQVWKYGSDIHQTLSTDKKLKNNDEIFRQIFEIAINKKAKRGRQIFILLLGSVKFSKYSKGLMEQLDDENVSGHIIQTIHQMKERQYVEQVQPFCNHEVAWIRNIAKKYVEKYKPL